MSILKNSRLGQGYAGMAIKNSVNHVSTAVIIKIGSLIFTAIIARLLMPELFGLYSLVFTTIFTFSSFADLGVGTALTLFVSKALAKNDEKKAKSYFVYLLKIKILLTVISFAILLTTAKFIATSYYQKPIFLALFAGSFFVIVLSLINFIEYLFKSSNQFQGVLQKEIFFQIARVLISPLIIILLLKYALTQEMSVLVVTISVLLPYIITFIFFSFMAKKKVDFLKSSSEELAEEDKEGIKMFILPLSVSLILQTILDNIDVILLGRFTNPEFIGYYSAAFNLVSPATAITALSTALFPIFSRLEGEQLKRGLKKSVKITLLMSLCLTILIIIFSPIMVRLVYGEDYLSAINLLRLGALVIIPSSIIGIYVNFFISKKKAKMTAKVLFFMVIIKAIIGFVLVTVFVKTSPFLAVIGVISARVITEYTHLGILLLFSRKAD